MGSWAGPLGTEPSLQAGPARPSEWGWLCPTSPEGKTRILRAGVHLRRPGGDVPALPTPGLNPRRPHLSIGRGCQDGWVSGRLPRPGSGADNQRMQSEMQTDKKSSRCCSQTRVSLRNHIQGPSQAVGHAVGAATEAQFQQLQTKQNTCVCVSEEHVLPLLPAWTGWVTWSASEFFRNCQTVFRHGCAIVPPTHDRQRGPSEKVPSMNQGVASPDIESARASILNFPSSAAVGMCVCCFYTTQATAFPDSSRGGESRCLCGTTLFVA
ncbi:uncharacterized protein [Symphalangus syndactylus]|uniref:uncharacterized protein isoform X1 n=1 Tax=Symphalangus syndactylus TaxID=9590 RepID=UPI0030051003